MFLVLDNVLCNLDPKVKVKDRKVGICDGDRWCITNCSLVSFMVIMVNMDSSLCMLCNFISIFALRIENTIRVTVNKSQ